MGQMDYLYKSRTIAWRNPHVCYHIKGVRDHCRLGDLEEDYGRILY